MDLLRTELERRMEVAASPRLIARALGSPDRGGAAGQTSALDDASAESPPYLSPDAGDLQARLRRRAGRAHREG
jgi:hypothetical protein